MRVAAAIIGELGATLGAFKGFTIVSGTLLLTVSGDDTGFNPLGLRGPAPDSTPSSSSGAVRRAGPRSLASWA